MTRTKLPALIDVRTACEETGLPKSTIIRVMRTCEPVKLSEIRLRLRPETPEMHLLVEARLLPADNEPDDARPPLRADNEHSHQETSA